MIGLPGLYVFGLDVACEPVRLVVVWPANLKVVVGGHIVNSCIMSYKTPPRRIKYRMSPPPVKRWRGNRFEKSPVPPVILPLKLVFPVGHSVFPGKVVRPPVIAWEPIHTVTEIDSEIDSKSDLESDTETA